MSLPSVFCVCLVAQLCPTLCDPLDCSLPGAFVHGILQWRILEWVAVSSSRGSSRLQDGTCVCRVSCNAGRFFSHWTMGAEPERESFSSPEGKVQEEEPWQPPVQCVAQTWSLVTGLSAPCPCSTPGGRARGGPGAVCHEDQKDPQRPREQGSVHGLVQG